MEKLARSQYLRKKDPKDCTLLYTALKRIPVLASLFKLSKDEKDKPLFGFLSRNFQEEKNKAAALKNAYVLMGKHQLEMAIAFFLLGGDNYSAITICAKNLGDLQLALVVSRLVENHGASLEGHLISNIIVPTASEKKNYWLASLLEFQLGNYSQAVVHVLGLDTCPGAMPIQNYHLSDPNVGLYLLFLTSRNNFKNALGERNSNVLGRWASFLVASSFTYYGFPLNALDFLVSRSRIESVYDNDCIHDEGDLAVLQPLLCLSSSKASNWLSGNVALYLDAQVKVNLTLHYFSNLITEHPGWSDLSPESVILDRAIDLDPEYEVSKTKFNDNLFRCLSTVEKRYAVDSFSIVNMILVWLFNNGLQAVGYDLLLDYIVGKDIHAEKSITDTLALNKILMKIVRDSCHSISLLTISCSIASFRPLTDCQSSEYHLDDVFRRKLLQKSLETLRVALRIFCRSLTDSSVVPNTLVDLYGYIACSSIFWVQQNPEGLLFIFASMDRNSYDIDMVGLRDYIACKAGNDEPGIILTLNKFDNSGVQVFKDVERWHVIGICLWLRYCNLFDHKVHVLALEEALSLETSDFMNLLSRCNFFHLTLNENKPTEISILTLMLVKFLKTTLDYVLSLHISQFISYLLWNIVNRCPVATFKWLKESVWIQTEGIHINVGETIDPRLASCLDALWSSCGDSKMISNILNNGKIDWSLVIDHFSKKSWTHFYEDISKVQSHDMLWSYENQLNCSSSGELESTSKGIFNTGHTYFRSQQKTEPAIPQFHDTKELFKGDGDHFEALCTNAADESQVAVSSNRKGIFFFNRQTEASCRDQGEYTWPESDWPCSRSRPGGATFGIPRYAGMGVSSFSWDIQDNDVIVDRRATLENMRTRTFSSHPFQPLFLAGSMDTRIYLLEFGNNKPKAVYGAHPDVNVSGLSAVQFDHYGHRFASASLDGIICIWQLDAWKRNSSRPTESCACFNDQASDVTYLPASGSIVASAGYNTNGASVVVWDTLAPPTKSQASIICHEGGASSISGFENVIGSSSISPYIVSGGQNGDVGIHDLRYITTCRTRYLDNCGVPSESDSRKLNNKIGNHNSNGMLWHIPKAHLGCVTKICTIPCTTLFLTGSKDGDVKLWDAKSANLVHHWPKMHEKRTFYRPRSRGIGGVIRAAVTDIQVVSGGFVTCGADGTVKHVRLRGYPHNI